jgi:HEAT repeat protein
LGETGAARDIAGLLADDDPIVRREAAEALGRLGAASEAPALVAGLADTEREVRKAVVEALLQPGNGSERPLLAAAVEDSEPGLRQATIRAMRAVAPAIAFDTSLREIPEATDPAGRREAAEEVLRAIRNIVRRTNNE